MLRRTAGQERLSGLTIISIKNEKNTVLQTKTQTKPNLYSMPMLCILITVTITKFYLNVSLFDKDPCGALKRSKYQ